MIRTVQRRPGRRVAMAGLAVVTLAGLLRVAAPASSAELSGPVTGPGGSGRCIDVAGDDTGATGAPVQVWDCLGVADQRWTVGGDGTLRTLGKCLDVEGYGTANSARIHLWDCHGGDNQQWRPRADGSILNPGSGRCLDDPAGVLTNGTQLQLWDCNGQWPQVWHLPGAGAPGGSFGTTTLHPEKLGVYAVPDLYYRDPARTEASLRRLHALLPHAWVRWDNETGHGPDTAQAVEGFIAQAERAGIPMIIAACCVDGYDNWWARGGSQPTVSITQIADGPYLDFAARMRAAHPNVRLVETINEPDTIWFVADPDNVPAWRHYLDRLTAAVGGDTDALLGPASAFRDSGIYRDTVARPEIRHVSYHTYGGWRSLEDVPGKADTFVTEYGDDSVPDGVERSPATSWPTSGTPRPTASCPARSGSCSTSTSSTWSPPTPPRATTTACPASSGHWPRTRRWPTSRPAPGWTRPTTTCWPPTTAPAGSPRCCGTTAAKRCPGRPARCPAPAWPAARRCPCSPCWTGRPARPSVRRWPARVGSG